MIYLYITLGYFAIAIPIAILVGKTINVGNCPD